MRTFVFSILFALMLSVPALADEDIIDKTAIEDSAPAEAIETVGGIESVTDTQSALERLWSKVTGEVSDNLSKVLGRAVSVVAVAVICGLLKVFTAEKAVPDWCDLYGCAAISILCLADIGSYISMCRSALEDVSAFSQSLLPALCTLGAGSGAISSATVKYAASALFMDMLLSAAVKLIMPAVLAFLALSVAASAFDSKRLSRLCKLLKKVCVLLMTALAIGFTAYLGISSAITSSADALALRAAKTAISTALPVVGGIVSDAASSVIGSAELLKSTVGVFGMLIIAAICAAPFVILGLNYLAYKAAAAGVSMLGSDRLSALTDSVGDAFGMLLGLVGCAGIMMFISIFSAIKAVSL